MLLTNVFGTNIVLVNILFLVFINRNLFSFNLDKKRIYDSFNTDWSY